MRQLFSQNLISSHWSEKYVSSFPPLEPAWYVGRLGREGVGLPMTECGMNALRTADPLSAALRWPGGLTVRRPYSVAGPNSLWHIGELCKYL